MLLLRQPEANYPGREKDGTYCSQEAKQSLLMPLHFVYLAFQIGSTADKVHLVQIKVHAVLLDGDLRQ
jgi:hypothetical protein